MVMTPTSVRSIMTRNVIQSKFFKSRRSKWIIIFSFLGFTPGRITFGYRSSLCPIVLGLVQKIRFDRLLCQRGRCRAAVTAMLDKYGKSDLGLVDRGDGDKPSMVHELLSRQAFLLTHNLRGSTLSTNLHKRGCRNPCSSTIFINDCR